MPGILIARQARARCVDRGLSIFIQEDNADFLKVHGLSQTGTSVGDQLLRVAFRCDHLVDIADAQQNAVDMRRTLPAAVQAAVREIGDHGGGRENSHQDGFDKKYGVAPIIKSRYVKL